MKEDKKEKEDIIHTRGEKMKKETKSMDRWYHIEHRTHIVPVLWVLLLRESIHLSRQGSIEHTSTRFVRRTGW